MHSYLYLKVSAANPHCMIKSGGNPHYDKSNVHVRVAHSVTTVTTVE